MLNVIFVNNQLDAQFFFIYVYFYSRHVSGTYMSIIRRINCVSTTSGICQSANMTVWYVGAYAPAYQTVFSYMFISILDMFRAPLYPSSGEVLFQYDIRYMSVCVYHHLTHRCICSCESNGPFLYIYFYSLHLTSLVVWWSESLTTNHEVLGSIPGYTVGKIPR